MDSKQDIYESARLIIKGSLVAILALTALLITYNIATSSTVFSIEFWFIGVAIPCLLFAGYFLRRGYYRISSWIIFILYFLTSFFILLLWGTGTPIGILILGFTVIIPSVLIGPIFTFPTISFATLLLILVQLIHATDLVTPISHTLSTRESHWEILVYATVLSIVGLVAWLSGHQRDKSLKRALRAEARLRAQKETLKDKLAEESQKLRLTQLEQINELHNFAVLGQTTAATLHDLSNHLSMLNLDIDDLSDQRQNSKTIASVKYSINAINTMIQESRRQLDTFEQHTTFDAVDTAHLCIKNVHHKYKQRKVKLTKPSPTKNQTFRIIGNSYALTQIVTILLNNALDACCTIPAAEVTTKIDTTPTALTISILDNGAGVDPTAREKLFKPKLSKKATGLGVGLYLAYHLTESVFGGTLELAPSETGAHFKVTIPRATTD